jgi:hypothetical protein
MSTLFSYPGLQSGGIETPLITGFSLKQYQDSPKISLNDWIHDLKLKKTT